MIRNIMALQRLLLRFARMSFRSSSLACCAVIVGGALPASAAIVTFDGHGQPNGNWSTPNNWVGNVLPTSGSPNLEVRIAHTAAATTVTSNQDLGNPFELQSLVFGAVAQYFAQHTINGSPIAFSNLGAAPTMSAFDGFVSPDLVMNANMILNADLTLSIEGGGDAASHWYLNGVISGPGGLKTSPPGIGGGILHLGGANANTYAGATTINYGWAYLTTPASVVAIPGDLFINRTGGTRDRSGRVYVQNDNQIATTSNVTIKGGTLYVQGGNQTLASVNFTGLNSPVLNQDGGNVVISPGRTLTVTGALTRIGVSDPFFTPSTSLISGGTLDLAGGVRTVQVDNLTPLGFTPTTLTISSIIANGNIEKTGVGVLSFSGANNTFAGNVLVSDGLFSIGQNFQMIFGLQNSGLSNRIAGTAAAALGGIFNIDPTAVSEITGVWNLVDVATLNETFDPGLKLQLSNGAQFVKSGSNYRMGRWSFSTVTGNLTLAETPEPATLGMGAMAALLVGAMGRRMGAKGRTASA